MARPDDLAVCALHRALPENIAQRVHNAISGICLSSGFVRDLNEYLHMAQRPALVIERALLIATIILCIFTSQDELLWQVIFGTASFLTIWHTLYCIGDLQATMFIRAGGLHRVADVRECGDGFVVH